ncbi:hypothetical protein Leryth_005454, partial [Lithospermum erythrorhizon]
YLLSQSQSVSQIHHFQQTPSHFLDLFEFLEHFEAHIYWIYGKFLN